MSPAVTVIARQSAKSLRNPAHLSFSTRSISPCLSFEQGVVESLELLLAGEALLVAFLFSRAAIRDSLGRETRDAGSDPSTDFSGGT
jgi:hypothetical protein